MPSLRLVSAASLLLLSLSLARGSSDTHTFESPIDALSVTLPAEDAVAQLSYLADGKWSDWQELHVENEQDPTLRESQLVMFPKEVTSVKIKGAKVVLNPVEVSHEPAHYDIAAAGNVGRPHILSRSEWGADESFLLKQENEEHPVETERSSDATTPVDGSQRAKDCAEAQLNWPKEFKAVRRTSANDEGKQYRWPQEYSGDVKMLVVHHTAMKVTGDTRSGAERVRALYAYHANNRGWGDIGYNFLIDETGQIYEGRSGGKYVIGGHAYCNNVNTMGVALLGNFSEELPSQEQIKSLQWLLAYLGDTYEIPMSGKVTLHGKTHPTVVGHRDLLTTDCPGDYAYAVLGQVRTHVAMGEIDEGVDFPHPMTAAYSDRTDERRQRRVAAKPTEALRAFPKEGLSPLGSTTLNGRPGQQILLSMRYQAGSVRIERAASIGEVNRSEDGIGLWQEKGGAFTRVSTNLNAPSLIAEGGTTLIRLKLQFPSEVGSYQITIGPWTYQLEVSGRRSRGRLPAGRQAPSESDYQESSQASSRRARPARTSASSSARSTHAERSAPSMQQQEAAAPVIRIRLTQQGPLSLEMTEGTVNDVQTGPSVYTLSQEGELCVATERTRRAAKGIVRFDQQNALVNVIDEKGSRRLRGIVECRVVDGSLMLINEIALEEYLWGLAEEPDTEPYQKQRAFAVTARTYAAYYMSPLNRKFPDKPYDGSDSPAEFQSYKGYDFESTHSMWVKAVHDTSDTVLKKDGNIIKPPYFSSDDGRTRTPQEAGWGTSFPFAEIYTSKPDPWCKGMTNRGHGVGMSGCGAEGQANEGKAAEDILAYYYPGTVLSPVR